MKTFNQYKLVDARHDHPLWFQRGAVDFFRGKQHRSFPTPTALYLVHSIQYDETTPRRYKVARFSVDRTDDVGQDHYGFDHQQDAERLAQRLSKLEATGFIVTLPHGGSFIACEVCGTGWATFEFNRHPQCSVHLGAAVRT